MTRKSEGDYKRKTTLEEEVFMHGRIPPQAIDFEEAVLGAVMLEVSALTEIIGSVKPEMFYKQAHKQIFSAISRLYQRNDPVDIITVTEELRKSGELEEAGGAYFVTILTDRIASTANVGYHSKIIIEKFVKRELIRVSSDIIKAAYDDQSDSFECLGMLEHAVTEVNEIFASGGNMKAISKLTDEAEVEARKREKLFKEGKCTGIPTGLKQLDKRTAGWQRGELIILAGRPSMGKTALMLHHAVSSGVNVCMYSLEMSGVSLADRMILSMADLDADKYKAGAMGQEEWRQFNIAKEKLSKMPIYVDDNAVVSTRYIKSHSKMMKDRGRCDIVFVDYLQLADMRSDQSGRNREQEVSQAAREFKIMAKSLDIPVIILSQLSRKCEARGNKKPLLSDLRESGAIEQDADIVIFAYRPAYYGLLDNNGNDQTGIGYEIIAKGRNIGVGDIPFRHNENMTKIYDYQYSSSYEPEYTPMKDVYMEPETEEYQESQQEIPF